MDVKELNRRLGLNLTEESVQQVLYHSSYPQQSASLRKRNKVYVSYGNSVILAAYAIYLYRNNDLISSGELSKILTSVRTYIQSKIYTHFKLEDFVIKDDAENGREHPDIASKIVVVMYQEKGFLQVYNFLRPFFSVTSDLPTVDYKSVISHYVESKKLSCLYKIIEEKGPEHDKSFTCQLTVGNKKVVGSSMKKKKDAETAAAKEFIRTYNISTIISNKTKNKKQIQSFKTASISNQRKEQIINVFNLFKINKNFVKIDQMDQVLTHASYVNEHSDKCYKSNETLAVVGAFAVEIFCYEYVLSNYDIETYDLVKEKGVLIREENIGNTISNQCLLSFLRAMGGDNAKSLMRYKNDIFKSLLAVFLLNYITTNNSSVFKEGKRFAFERLKLVEKNKVLDYRTFLHELSQKHHLTLKYSIQLNNENQNLFVSKLDVCNENGLHSISVGSGLTKKESENKASKEMLLSLFKYVGDDKQSKEAILSHLDPETRCLMEGKSKIPKTETSLNNEPDSKKPLVTKPMNLTNDLNGEKREVSFDTPRAVLYICKGTIACENNNHSIISATGILNSIKGEVIKINVNFCSSCNMFFISYSEYKHYRDLHGALLGNFLFKNTNGRTIASSYAELAEESILRICGYTVSQLDNLKPYERRMILGNIMDRKILRKDEILGYLDFFINNSRNRTNMRVAVKKWTDDQEWVRHYNIDYQRTFFIGDIKRYQ